MKTNNLGIVFDLYATRCIVAYKFFEFGQEDENPDLPEDQAISIASSMDVDEILNELADDIPIRADFFTPEKIEKANLKTDLMGLVCGVCGEKWSRLSAEVRDHVTQEHTELFEMFPELTYASILGRVVYISNSPVNTKGKFGSTKLLPKATRRNPEPLCPLSCSHMS